jgi:hypothetical protein
MSLTPISPTPTTTGLAAESAHAQALAVFQRRGGEALVVDLPLKFLVLRHLSVEVRNGGYQDIQLVDGLRIIRHMSQSPIKTAMSQANPQSKQKWHKQRTAVPLPTRICIAQRTTSPTWAITTRP